MVRAQNKENISGDVPAELQKELIEWISDHKDLKIAQCVQTMTELWLSLPLRLQAILLVAKRDADAFDNVTNEIEENLLTFFEAFARREKESGDCVRRMMLILKDYALTGCCINSLNDLDVFMDAIYDIIRCIPRTVLDQVSEKDQDTIKRILQCFQSDLQAKETKKAVRKVGSRSLRAISHKKKTDKPSESG